MSRNRRAWQLVPAWPTCAAAQRIRVLTELPFPLFSAVPTLEMASPARCLALLCCLVAAALSAGGAAAAPSAHERACGTAFGVLQRCAASGVAQETVRARCCGLLGIFRRNGCLW